jgi:hypothetical protein
MMVRKVNFRGTVTVVRRQHPISDEDYENVLLALNQRHEELGAVGCGGDADSVTYVMNTDAYEFEAPAAREIHDAVVDALQYVGAPDAWPPYVELEEIEDETGQDDEPKVAHG